METLLTESMASSFSSSGLRFSWLLQGSFFRFLLDCGEFPLRRYAAGN
jgi:hypothetical protein